MKSSIGLCLGFLSWFLCSQTVRADLVLGPAGLNADDVSMLGLLPVIILVVIVTVFIIQKIKK